MGIKRATAVQVFAALLSLSLVGVLVMHSSKAAFNAQTSNPTNGWTTGGVAIGDDDLGVAMFTTATDGTLTGGQVLTKCIVVSYSGTTTSGVAVKLFAASSGALAPYLDLRIREGSGAAFGNCTGFTSAATLYTGTLSGFSTASSNFGNGVSSWAPTGNESKTYEFQVTVQNVSGAHNKTGAGTFTWEAQG